MASPNTIVAFPDYRRRPLRQLRRAPRLRQRGFGRRAPFTAAAPVAPQRAISDDLRLFGATFAAGFLFVSVLIA